jgi:hypothetical protein
MIKPKTICQSCASPLLLNYDHGTEKDSSPSDLYCRRCYQMGSFTEPNMTVEKMHEIIRVKMIGLRFPRFLAKLSANGVFELKRWAAHQVVPQVAAGVSSKG